MSYNYNLGLSYYQLADYKNAIKFYALSLNFDNKYVIAYSNKGAAEHKAGLIEDALSSYLSAYELDKENIKQQDFFLLVHYFGFSISQQETLDFCQSKNHSHVN